jgi:DNA repair protein RadA/Sms
MDGYECSGCGHRSQKWFGRCPRCGGWSTASAPRGEAVEVTSLAHPGAEAPRLATGMTELDRVLGGGLVPGGAVLLAGEPGIGKSTLVLQMLDALARQGRDTLLVTGEESVAQVSLRASRLGVGRDDLRAAATTDLRAVLAVCEDVRPGVLVVDSIQAMDDPQDDHASGSQAAVRGAAASFVRFAKRSGTVVVLVGHVTKDGSVAGPKALEHIVDVVLVVEGERNGAVRVLRADKNRFGSCEETGVFVMRERGLQTETDPSAMLLADRRPGVNGSVVFPSLDGSRPVLIEIQALVAPGNAGQPRRVALGVDPRRLALLLGVLSRHTPLKLGQHDVFVAAAGGLRVKEPAADLAVCLALSSAFRGFPVDAGTVAFGEVGLGGEVRRVPGMERRLAEAARLGFSQAVVPRVPVEGDGDAPDIEVAEAPDLASALATAAVIKAVA